LKLSASDVLSAAAFKTQSGEWEVNIRLTGAGAAKWDAVAQKAFHQFLAIEQDGRVLSVPIMQPAQTSFSSFDGAMTVSGTLTKQQAVTLAGVAKARG
jgi:preprotein translocase subunit SecD